MTQMLIKYVNIALNPPNTVSFMPTIPSTSGSLHSEFIRLLFLRVAFSSMFKSRVGNILTKTAVLRVTLNLDGTPITSKSHTHITHSQSSRLLTSSLAPTLIYRFYLLYSNSMYDAVPSV